MERSFIAFDLGQRRDEAGLGFHFSQKLKLLKIWKTFYNH